MKRILAATIAAVFVLAGCTKTTTGNGPGNGNGQTRANRFTVPHTLRMTVGEEIETLNPLLTPDTPVSLMIGPLSMGYLVRWDKQGQPIPELITDIPTQKNGGVSKDGLTITYHLRKGVKWSDGQPFNADDVIFSVHAVMNPANNVTNRTGFDRITKMDEPDKYTVVLHMSKAYSPFLETFFSTAGANPCLLPKHLLAQYPNLNQVAYNSKPVGIGPFMVQKWDRGQRVVLVPNPFYFRGQPKLKRIEYEIIPNANTVLTEIQGRTLDLWYQAPQNVYTKVKTLAGFGTLIQPSYYFRHLDFNLTSPRLQDPAVRQALRYAADRPTILAKVYHGIGILQDQPAPKVSVYWDPAVKLVPFDVNKANQMLDQAGWVRGPDGVRAKNGVRLELNVATASGNPINDSLIEQLRETWKTIGVTLTVSHYLNSLLFAQTQDGGILNRGKFDVAYFAWGEDAIGDMSSIYACDQIPPNGQNIMHWCNPAANKAMHDLYLHYDQSDRNKDDAILAEQLDKDVPTIVIMGTAVLWVYNKDIVNFQPGALSPFDNFMNVDI
jgi:peptide/nickel transport system substrate-binding protein